MKNVKEQKQKEQGGNAAPQKKSWSREKVGSFVAQDITAAVGFLQLIQTEPRIQQLVADILWERIQEEREASETIDFKKEPD